MTDDKLIEFWAGNVEMKREKDKNPNVEGIVLDTFEVVLDFIFISF